MPAPIGKLGYGVVLMVGATTAAVTATVHLGGLTNVPPPPFNRDQVDVTNQDSPGSREFIPGLADFGEVSMELNWVPGNATDLVLQEMTDEDEPRLFTSTFTQVTPNRICTFSAYLTSFEPGVPIDDKMSAAITLKITGKPVWSNGV